MEMGKTHAGSESCPAAPRYLRGEKSQETAHVEGPSTNQDAKGGGRCWDPFQEKTAKSCPTGNNTQWGRIVGDY